jgi:hypothetical protein
MGYLLQSGVGLALDLFSDGLLMPFQYPSVPASVSVSRATSRMTPSEPELLNKGEADAEPFCSLGVSVSLLRESADYPLA